MIKYNHLIANCVCFYNVYTINQILNDLVNEEIQFEKEALERFSPYITRYINRFGDYNLNLDKEIPNLNYKMPIL